MTAAVQSELFDFSPEPPCDHGAWAGVNGVGHCLLCPSTSADELPLRPADLPSLEEQQAATVALDALMCVCGHKCESHGSHTRGVFQGVGGGQCGWDDYPGPCPCARFEVTP